MKDLRSAAGPPPADVPWYALPVEEAVVRLGVEPSRGL